VLSALVLVLAATAGLLGLADLCRRTTT